jgi:hypothetical protein
MRGVAVILLVATGGTIVRRQPVLLLLARMKTTRTLDAVTGAKRTSLNYPPAGFQTNNRYPWHWLRAPSFANRLLDTEAYQPSTSISARLAMARCDSDSGTGW